MNPGSPTPISEARYINRIDGREFYMNGIFSRRVVLHILEKYPPGAIDTVTGLSTDNAVRAIIHAGLRYNHMSVKDNGLFMLVALKQITKNDLLLSGNQLVDKVKRENTDMFDLDVSSRIVAQVATKLPADLRERMTARQKVAIMTYVNNQVEQPSIGEAFMNTMSSSMHAGSSQAVDNAMASNNVLHASYVDNEPVLHMNAKTKELYYYDENAHALIPLSDVDTLNSKGVTKEQLEKHLKDHDLSNKEIKELLNSLDPNYNSTDQNSNNNNSNNNNSNNKDDAKNDKKSKDDNMGVGVILGITGGVVAFLLLVALILFILKKK